jgi:hypothetical protein
LGFYLPNVPLKKHFYAGRRYKIILLAKGGELFYDIPKILRLNT